ncbi:hypothetical protein Ahy_A07g034864 isoform A [Arachis hypogaea]|uniref:Uncharacterized protein n=1 Tax=Arachis hypogaea TaxID=3818 RepID=A0A445CCV6_ARAHY|nr:hypothetical protein Ahy_A07g034864 isoform A [Arachis hypogaea]
MKRDFTHQRHKTPLASFALIMKKCYFFLNTKPLYKNALSLRISLKITQTSLMFSTKTTTGKESREDFARNNSVDSVTRALNLISVQGTSLQKANKEAKNKNKEIREERKRKERKKNKIVDLDSSSEEDKFFESESESESDKTPPAKRTRQQRMVKKQKLVETDSETTTRTESSPTDSESKSESEYQEEEIEKTATKKLKQPQKVIKKQSKKRKPVPTDSESTSKSEGQTEHVKDSAAERRRQALEMIREKRSKKRNDGAQTVNVALDRFDSTEGQNDFSEKLPTVNLGSEPLLQTQASSIPSVNAPNIPGKIPRKVRAPLALSLPSSLKEELIKDDFIYVPPKSQTQQTSDNNSPLEPQQQPCKEAPTQQSEQQKQAAEESSPRNIEPEPPINVSPPKQQQQQQAPVAQQFKEKAQPDFIAHPRQWEDDVPSFSLGIITLPSEPTQPYESTVSQLEILEKAVVDAGVTAALKFAKAITAEPTFPAAEVYKTLEKKKEITEELIEKCYHH